MSGITLNKLCRVVDHNVLVAIFGLGAVIALSLPCYAGAQSILDPYASIQPSTPAAESKPLFAKKVAKKPVANIDNPSETSNTSAPRMAKPVKVTSNSASNGSGFMSGVKEIQHGYITSIKAAGGGIVHGSKAAGAKIVESTKGICAGVSSASHKVTKDLAKKAPAPSEKQNQIAEANPLPTLPSKPARSNYPNLPGKPLDQAIAAKKTKLKDAPLVQGKEGLLAHTFNKLNFFKKQKKIQPAKVAATNSNGLAQ